MPLMMIKVIMASWTVQSGRGDLRGHSPTFRMPLSRPLLGRRSPRCREPGDFGLDAGMRHRGGMVPEAWVIGPLDPATSAATPTSKPPGVCATPIHPDGPRLQPAQGQPGVERIGHAPALASFRQ